MAKHDGCQGAGGQYALIAKKVQRMQLNVEFWLLVFRYFFVSPQKRLKTALRRLKCFRDLAVLFQGEHATAFKPSTSDLPINGKEVLKGKLDKSAKLCMVDVPTANHCKL